MTRSPGRYLDDLLARDPLAWWLAEHERHRNLCGIIDAVARSPDYHGEALSHLIVFLRDDLPRHAGEEEDIWFPQLRARARRGDDFIATMAALTADHGRNQTEMAAILTAVEALDPQARSPFLDVALAARLIELASRERQHLAVENAVLIPIARIRLTAGDLQMIGRAIAVRRARGDRPQAAN